MSPDDDKLYTAKEQSHAACRGLMGRCLRFCTPALRATMATMTKCSPAVLALLVLTACEQKDTPPEPRTPEEMYAHVQYLLKPHVEGEQSDFAGAMQWLRKAAEAGHLQAQTDLGGIYLQGGKGVAPNPQEAFRWFSKAAEQGSNEARVYLGSMLSTGQGCTKDVPQAKEHLRQAAAANLPEAQYRLAMLMLQENAPADYPESLDLLARAAAGKSLHTAALAARALGNIYAKGNAGVQADMHTAANWYKQAARGGDARSQLVYAIMLLDGQWVPKDEQQGMAMLRLAAGQDYPQAIALLINLLRNAPNAADYEAEAAAWASRLDSLRSSPRQPAS